MTNKLALAAFATVLSLATLSLPFVPWGNNKHPKNFKNLYTALVQGYDVSYSGNLKNCYHPLSQEKSGAIISAFQYFNDTKVYGAERLQFTYQSLGKNTTNNNNYAWNYWSQTIFPNQTINIYTSDFTYNYDDEKNSKLTECSFDNFDFRVIEYTTPTHLKNYAAVKQAFSSGQIVRFRNFAQTCQYRDSKGGLVAPNVIQGAIIPSYKLYAEAGGIQEYISFSLSGNYKNLNQTVPEMLTELEEVKIYKNGTAIFNVNTFDSNTRSTLKTYWLSCEVTGKQGNGINFFTTDHSLF